MVNGDRVSWKGLQTGGPLMAPGKQRFVRANCWEGNIVFQKREFESFPVQLPSLLPTESTLP